MPVCRANDPRSLLSVNGGDADQASAVVLNVNFAWPNRRNGATTPRPIAGNTEHQKKLDNVLSKRFFSFLSLDYWSTVLLQNGCCIWAFPDVPSPPTRLAFLCPACMPLRCNNPPQVGHFGACGSASRRNAAPFISLDHDREWCIRRVRQNSVGRCHVSVVPLPPSLVVSDGRGSRSL